jgi:hypothetical protein
MFRIAAPAGRPELHNGDRPRLEKESPGHPQRVDWCATRTGQGWIVTVEWRFERNGPWASRNGSAQFGQ